MLGLAVAKLGHPIDPDTYTSVLGLLAAGALASLRHAVAKAEVLPERVRHLRDDV